jgi:FAD synthase
MISVSAKNRRGGFATLREFAQRHGFQLEHTTTCKAGQRRISSSWVREALAAGDMILAETLLGRPYAISGRVIHGDKRGRDLGYPTLNIDLHRMCSPVTGIFVSRAHGLGMEARPAVTSIGIRPMFDGTKMLLESHLLDFSGDVYGAYVSVELLQRLRGEEIFSSNSELKQQIERDINCARQYFDKQK